ncbi:MAG: hypothetical protein JKY50_00430 [Oleispira sp.]|nr:hypothetical protein [Oleispira sp.]
MNDLELEEAVAEIEGTAVHNCLAGGRSFPSYLEWRLTGPLMEKHSIELSPLFNGEWCASFINTYTFTGDPVYGIQAVDKSPTRAILLAIIEANNE